MKSAVEYRRARNREARLRLLREEVELSARMGDTGRLKAFISEWREAAGPPNGCWCGAPVEAVPSGKYRQRHKKGYRNFPPSPDCLESHASNAYETAIRDAIRKRLKELSAVPVAAAG